MKRVLAALCIVSLLNLAAAQAGPVEKQKFSTDELLALSERELASLSDVRQVEAGLLGATNSLINLALYGALIFGGYKLAENISDDD